MPTFVDREVAGRDQVVFPAGTPGTLVCLQTDELFGDDPVVITALTSDDDEAGTGRHAARQPLGGAARTGAPRDRLSWSGDS